MVGPLSYRDSTLRLTPELPVTTLGVEAVITQVEVSPLGSMSASRGTP